MKTTKARTTTTKRAKTTKPHATKRTTTKKPAPVPIGAALSPARVATPEPVAPVPVVVLPLVRSAGRGRSEAGRRGAELVRFLRIHRKHAYGSRGEAAIVALARDVAHVARVELEAAAS
jgi:hypothetical protein